MEGWEQLETSGRRGGDREKRAGTQCARSWRGDACSPISGRDLHPGAFVSTEGLVLLCVDDRLACIRSAQESVCCVPDWLPVYLPRSSQTSWVTLALWRLNLGHTGHSEMSLMSPL